MTSPPTRIPTSIDLRYLEQKRKYEEWVFFLSFHFWWLFFFFLCVRGVGFGLVADSGGIFCVFLEIFVRFLYSHFFCIKTKVPESREVKFDFGP